MENTMKMYVTADEAAQILGASRGYIINYLMKHWNDIMQNRNGKIA